MKRTLVSIWLAGVMAMAVSTQATSAIFALAIWFIDDMAVPLSPAMAVVTDPGTEFSYDVGASYRLSADFTDASLTIAQTDLTTCDQPADSWSMRFTLDTTDWVNGATLTSQKFDPPLSRSIRAANSLLVQWDGPSLLLDGFAATLQNEPTTQPVPERTIALLSLGDLTALGEAGRGAA
jgi:hypothetical protein